MAHAAAHLKKARSEMEPPPDLKALEKAKERRRKSRERAERKRKVVPTPPLENKDSLSGPFLGCRCRCHANVFTLLSALCLRRRCVATVPTKLLMASPEPCLSPVCVSFVPPDPLLTVHISLSASS
ncbi:unnamed protein product [Lota lota]